VLLLPYRENEDLTLPYKFNYEFGCSDKVSTEVFNSFNKPFILPSEFHHGRLVQPSYEFYNPNVAARQLGCGQLPPRIFFSTIIRFREVIRDGIEANKVFELGCTLPTYEPSPFRIIEAAHPLFSSWWQEWHAHICNVPVHPLCQDLQPQFAPDSEVISLHSSSFYVLNFLISHSVIHRTLNPFLLPKRFNTIKLGLNLSWDSMPQLYQFS
jgi:hypothetical protein